MSGYTITNLTEVEDAAAKAGFGHIGTARFPNSDLETEQTGLSHHHLKPGARQAFGHRHDEVEEVYLVLGGAGRVKLDEEVVEISERDAVRVAPAVVRAFEAGDRGLELLAFGNRRPDDRGEVLMDWWT